jgi:hypothetical protein
MRIVRTASSATSRFARPKIFCVVKLRGGHSSMAGSNWPSASAHELPRQLSKGNSSQGYLTGRSSKRSASKRSIRRSKKRFPNGPLRRVADGRKSAPPHSCSAMAPPFHSRTSTSSICEGPRPSQNQVGKLVTRRLTPRCSGRHPGELSTALASGVNQLWLRSAARPGGAAELIVR